MSLSNWHQHRINQSNIFRDILLIFFFTIKAAYLFDDISCRCIMTCFMGQFPYVFARPSFLLIPENKLQGDLSWILNSSIYCIVLTLDVNPLDVNLLTSSIVSSIVILYSFGVIPAFHIFCFQVFVLSTKPVTKLEQDNGDVRTDQLTGELDNNSILLTLFCLVFFYT